MSKPAKKTRTLLLLVLICVFYPKVLLASTFSETYANYQAAVQARDWPLALSSAEQALEAGIGTLDPAGENVANLRLNYARELLRDKQFGLATSQLELCLKAKIGIHGRSSPELIDVILELARSTVQSDAKEAAKYYKRVLKLARQQGNELLEAKIKLGAGLKLSRAGEIKVASQYLGDARTFYSQRYGNIDLRAGMAALNLGQIQFSDKDYKKARQTLNNAMEAFQTTDPESQKFGNATRMLLVQTLEILKMRDQATEHVVALATNNATNGNALPTVLYKGAFYGPSSFARNSNGVEGMGGGLSSVAITFDIDENGFVVNPIAQTTSSRAISSAAIKTVRSRRYSPRIENGKPVTTRGLVYEYRLKSTVEIY